MTIDEEVVSAVIDVERVRADTEDVDRIVHLNNAGSSLPPRPVVDAQVEYLRTEQVSGGYETAERYADRLDDLYDATATMLGCGPDEIAFTGSASEAWWRAFTAVELRPGDRVLTGTSEFQAGAFGLLQARDRGVEVELVPGDGAGVIDLDELDRRLDERVRLMCFTQISMSNGAVQPVAEVGRRCREHGVTYLLDACQAAGQLSLDVDAIGCDFLTYTGRKFMRGPRGTGILYARSSVLAGLALNPFVDGRSAEWLDDGDHWRLEPTAKRFEFGEQNYAGKLGLAVATRYALALGLDDIADRVRALAETMRERLGEIAGVTVLDEGLDRSGIVTFAVDGHEPAAVGAHLRAHGINVSTPGRRNAQWDIGRRGIDAVVRAGVHYFNTEDEIDRLADAVATI